MESVTVFINEVIEIFLIAPIGQSIWLIAFLVSIYNFLFCKNKKFIFFTMIASLIWGIHFHIIGLTAAALINGVDVIKNILALKYERNKYLASLFVIVYIIIWFLTYNWYISLIPTLNAVLGTFLVFFVRGIWLNLGFIVVVMLWGVYNFLWHSIGGFMTDITLLFTWIIGVIRIMLEEKKADTIKEEK